MSTFAADSNTQTNHWLYPLLADLIGIGLFLLLNSFFEQRFSRSALDFSALTDAFVLILPYILFLVGVHQVQRLIGGSAEFLQNRIILGLLAIPFALALTVAIADLTGYLNSIFTVDFGDMGNGYYFLTTPAIYFFFSLLYFFVLIQPINTPINLSAHILAPLLGINLFTVAAASYLNVTIINMAPFAHRGLILVVLLFLFTLPRIIYFIKTRSWQSAISFDLFILLIVILL